MGPGGVNTSGTSGDSGYIWKPVPAGSPCGVSPLCISAEIRKTKVPACLDKWIGPHLSSGSGCGEWLFHSESKYGFYHPKMVQINWIFVNVNWCCGPLRSWLLVVVVDDHGDWWPGWWWWWWRRRRRWWWWLNSWSWLSTFFLPRDAMPCNAARHGVPQRLLKPLEGPRCRGCFGMLRFCGAILVSGLKRTTGPLGPKRTCKQGMVSTRVAPKPGRFFIGHFAHLPRWTLRFLNCMFLWIWLYQFKVFLLVASMQKKQRLKEIEHENVWIAATHCDTVPILSHQPRPTPILIASECCCLQLCVPWPQVFLW